MLSNSRLSFLNRSCKYVLWMFGGILTSVLAVTNVNKQAQSCPPPPTTNYFWSSENELGADPAGKPSGMNATDHMVVLSHVCSTHLSIVCRSEPSWPPADTNVLRGLSSPVPQRLQRIGTEKLYRCFLTCCGVERTVRAVFFFFFFSWDATRLLILWRFLVTQL